MALTHSYSEEEFGDQSLSSVSMDKPPTFSRMEELVCELEKICGRVRQRRKLIFGMRAGGAAEGVTASVIGLGFLFAPLTAGLSVAVAGAGIAVGVSGAAVGAAGSLGGTVLSVQIRDKLTQKVKRLIIEFCDLVLPLKDAQREENAMIKKLFLKDMTVERLLVVTKICRNILKELEENWETSSRFSSERSYSL